MNVHTHHVYNETNKMVQRERKGFFINIEMAGKTAVQKMIKKKKKNNTARTGKDRSQHHTTK